MAGDNLLELLHLLEEELEYTSYLFVECVEFLVIKVHDLVLR